MLSHLKIFVIMYVWLSSVVYFYLASSAFSRECDGNVSRLYTPQFTLAHVQNRRLLLPNIYLRPMSPYLLCNASYYMPKIQIRILDGFFPLSIYLLLLGIKRSSGQSSAVLLDYTEFYMFVLLAMFCVVGVGVLGVGLLVVLAGGGVILCVGLVWWVGLDGVREGS